jgi:CHAT domain-containing protein
VNGNDILVFVLSVRGLKARRLTDSAALVEAHSRRFLASIQRGDDADATAAGDELHDELIEPFLAEIGDAQTLVIAGSPAAVPLPFAALRSPQTGRFLVEDRTIVYTADVAGWLAAFQRDQQARRESKRADYDVLTVAPKYDDVATPGLEPLPTAPVEAVEIHKIYRRSSSLIGREATRMSFTRSAGHAVVVHFAGHSISNGEQPRYAALAFGNAGTRGPEMLYAYDIAGSSFPMTRLVVLASCSSAITAGAPFVAPTSLADAFLQADVPGVVATFWPIPDDVGESLLVDFHRNLAAGAAAPAALRQAQIAALRSGDLRRAEVRTWSAYCFTGWHSGK